MKIKDKLLGEMKFDEQWDSIEGEIQIKGRDVSFGIAVDDVNDKDTIRYWLGEMKKFVAEFDKWDRQMKRFAAKGLMESNQQYGSLKDGKIGITEKEFEERITIHSIAVDEDEFAVYYDDDNIFQGHSIVIYGTWKTGMEYVIIAV